jgi:hypothetical protein
MSLPSRLTGGLAVLLLFTAAAPASAQDAHEQRKAFAEGTHVFRRILFNKGFRQGVADFRNLEGDERNCIVIFLGDLSRLNELPGVRLRKFLNNGGAVLLASDQPANPDISRQLREDVGTCVTEHYTFDHSQDVANCHANKRERPFVQPVRGANPDLFNTQPRVATNIPGFLEDPQATKCVLLAELPGDCVWRSQRDGQLYQWVDNETNRRPMGRPFAVGGEYGDGRLLFLADPSIFVNGMMIPTDNHNVEFTEAALDWLADRGKQQRRTRLLLVEDGMIRTDFEVPLQVPASPDLPNDDELDDLLDKIPEEDLVRMADSAMGKFEEDNGFNNTLLDWLQRHEDSRSSAVTRLYTLAFMLGGLGILLAGGVMLVRRRYRIEAGLPTLNRATGQHTPTAPPPEERQQAMVKADNLYEAARGVARGVFVDAGLPDPPPGAKRRRPHIVVAGGWWRRWRLQRRIVALWRLAYGKRPMRVRLSGWKALLQEAEELRTALAKGTIRLEAV